VKQRWEKRVMTNRDGEGDIGEEMERKGRKESYKRGKGEKRRQRRQIM
jgi:hypothetical protein